MNNPLKSYQPEFFKLLIRSGLKILGILLLFTSISSPVLNAQSSSDAEGKVIMGIFAHPDDEILASTIFHKYIREGAEVVLVTATDGRLGTNDYNDYEAGDELAEIRRGEMQCSAETLGAKLYHLDYEDQLKTAEGFDGFVSQSQGLLEDLHRIIGDEQPDVIVTFGPDGFSNHIDHRIVGVSATQVVLSKEWEKMPQLFYMGFPSSQLDEMNTIYRGTLDGYLTVRVPYSEEDGEVAMAMAECHQSQFSPQVLEMWRERMSGQERVVYLRPFVKPEAEADDLFEYIQMN
jgi:LmbE family N-acetylglucosaminyl deacetylase